MIFLILPFQPNDVFEDFIQKLEEPVYSLSESSVSAYLVAFRGTTQELSAKLGYDDGKAGTGLIVPVSNYYGYASKDLWEWLKAYEHI